MTTYALDNASRHARRRLGFLESVFDPGTVRILTERGVGEGWRCAEIGAGAGSIAAWLARRVGPTGRVLATDINPTFLEPLAAEHPNLSVVRHDVAAEDLPGGPFDLIHTRLVLEHLPARAEALTRIVAALAPGGWLVIEAIEFATEWPDPSLPAAMAARFVHFREAETRLLADRGFDLLYARGAVRRLRDAGLEHVASEGRVSTWAGGSAGATVWALSVEQLREQHVAGGYLAPGEIEHILAMLENPAFAATSPMILAAWGRRPPS